MGFYSNVEDCFDLAIDLKNEMRNRIRFYGSTFQGVLSGKYFFEENEYMYGNKGLPFYIKFARNGFLRIQIGDSLDRTGTTGQKLAALSDFYEFLCEKFGDATVYYTCCDDDESTLSLHWSFINKDSDVEKFKNDTFFDDASIGRLIVIGEDKTALSSKTKKAIASNFGLPFELISLIDENIDDFITYKYEKNLKFSEKNSVYKKESN